MAKVAYKSFKAMLVQWDEVFRKVATFAETLPPDSMLAISQAADDSKSVVVWYWDSDSKAPTMPVEYRYFRGSLTSWDKLFRQAADFADSLSEDRVLSISQSWDGLDGMVTVWFWRPDKCLSCDSEFPLETKTCPTCGWTYESSPGR